ncbi:MAG: CpsD/CapB family tyrosine-protein kinase [Clostridia bacterium]|nr:CpsD/CapB family tyrosine-protein kinase [Clostridia bacterium]
MSDTGKINQPIIGVDMSEEGTSEFISIVRKITSSLNGMSYRCVAVSSATGNEGKDCVALNLACAAALTGHRTLVVDCDMESRMLSEITGIDSAVGLSDLLLGVNSDSKVFNRMAPNVDIMFAGTPAENAHGLITGTRMQKMITLLGKKYDFVILDLPAVCASENAARTASFTNGLLMVVGNGICQKSDLKTAAGRLNSCNISASWIVMNDKANCF